MVGNVRGYCLPRVQRFFITQCDALTTPNYLFSKLYIGLSLRWEFVLFKTI